MFALIQRQQSVEEALGQGDALAVILVAVLIIGAAFGIYKLVKGGGRK